MSTNRLAGETSPYLQQHKHNPVDWYPWGEEALRRAKEEDKPILLSVGYSACHWCHVMERESFENEEIAKLMNQHFVCIKVDREERPDIDQIYMAAVQMMTGQGGWPMTVFLTPDGKPFYGGTYYPPDDRYGRPGFPKVLEAVADAWKNRRQEIQEQGAAMVGEMKRATEMNLQPGPVMPDVFDRAYESLRRSFDSRFGGFGGAPKFPQPMIIDFLLRYHLRSKRDEPLRIAELTLEKMAFGGMYDQLGGGFHRYSTDEQWLVPHFEKMLYDNAQLALAYLHAYQVTGEPLYRRITEETLDYVRREMTSPLGGFYSSQDADSEGEEGKSFVWAQDEIERSLGRQGTGTRGQGPGGTGDAELFCRFYGITEQGNFEGKSILNVTAPAEAFAKSIGLEATAFESLLAEMRRKLFDFREGRIKPGRDDKILTAWNGLMLAAFADAGAVLERADYLQTAVNNAEFVLRELYRDSGGARRLMRTGKGETAESVAGHSQPGFRLAPIPGFLEDYACYADGLLRLYEATFDRRWLESAIELADQMIELFADEKGGFFDTAADSEALIERPKDQMDNATPSGSSVAVEVLLRLAVLTGKEEYRQRAAAVLRTMDQALSGHPHAFGRLLCAADFYVGPTRELAIIGGLDESGIQELIRAARAAYHPNMIVAQANPGDPRSAESPILAGKPHVHGKPTAYLCENYTCRQPTRDAKELQSQLLA